MKNDDAHVERMKREARDVESGWLIERAHPGGPVWAAIPDPQLAHYLITRLRTAIVPTSDATRALRFAREADAEAFRLANLSEWADTRSTEHVFLPPTATPEAPDAHP